MSDDVRSSSLSDVGQRRIHSNGVTCFPSQWTPLSHHRSLCLQESYHPESLPDAVRLPPHLAHLKKVVAVSIDKALKDVMPVVDRNCMIACTTTRELVCYFPFPSVRVPQISPYVTYSTVHEIRFLIYF